MPIVAVNGVSLSFEQHGSGEPVVLITGSGAKGRTWAPHQVPALTKAGYRAITVDNRGVSPTSISAEGFTLGDMAADIAGLIQILEISPCRLVGFSLGGMIAQELLLAHPDLIKQAVLMATRGRTDALRAALSAAESELLDRGISLPRRYAAVVHAMQFLSPRTMNNEQRIQDWLDVFEMSLADSSVPHPQRDLEVIDNRLDEYSRIKCPCLVISFNDDIIAPPYLGREVAERIPDCRYEQITGCGHYGYIEEPDVVNSSIINFFREG